MQPARRLLALAAAAILMTALAARPSLAKPDPTEDDIAAARVEFQAGEEHFAAGRYQEAVAAYRRAHERYPKPGFLYNIAQSYRLSEQCALATEYYERFLAADPAQSLAEQARAHVESLAECTAQERDAETATSESEPAEPVPAVETSEPVASDDGGQGGATELDLSAAVAPGDGSWKKPTGLAVAAVGIAVTATGGYFVYRSNKINKEVNRATPEMPIDSDRYDRGERANLLSWVLIPSGAAAIAAGVGLYLWGASEESSQIAVTPGQDGARMVWTGSF